MSQAFHPRRLDLTAFARAGATVSGGEPLSGWPRLIDETRGEGADRPLQWTARGEWRQPAGAAPQVWLHLQAEVALPLVCQRCMGAVDWPVRVDRSFRFVEGEDAAAAEDEDAEEDVLALSPVFDLAQLVEDEIVMELPLVPRHEVCPVPVRMAAADPDFDTALATKEPHPFAALAALKQGKSEGS